MMTVMAQFEKVAKVSSEKIHNFINDRDSKIK